MFDSIKCMFFLLAGKIFSEVHKSEKPEECDDIKPKLLNKKASNTRQILCN